jgi:NADP-dependent aldehyde dehydrogenase
MNLQPVLNGGQWRQSQSPDGNFRAFNPQTSEKLDAVFPISSASEIEEMLRNARAAMDEIGDHSQEKLARFLEKYADNIEARSAEILESAHLETALPIETRLKKVELPRTTNQLRQAAAAARSGDWRGATIDTKNNIRSMLAPMNGPIAIFGPNNFPLAFNAISGGDFVAAIATGHAVIAKAHPSHPRTTQLLAQCALDALQHANLPLSLVQLFYDAKPETGFRLVSHPLIGASAFTGSKRGGLALKAAADAAHKPIYLEMSSVNPTFVLPAALQSRGEKIAQELAAACLMAAGQFCTKPGLVIIPKSENAENFIAAFSQVFKADPTPLFGAGSTPNISEGLEKVRHDGVQIVRGGKVAAGDGFVFENTLLSGIGEDFLQHPGVFQTEMFGPVCLIVVADDANQMLEIAAEVEGSLTGCIYGDEGKSDEEIYARLAPILRPRVGRLINDKPSTGVAVSPAMVHGGPPPSTGHAGFTAVGIPASLRRFGALHCYDNVRDARLPAPLQNKNPTGKMWRCIDGNWTQKNAKS